MTILPHPGEAIPRLVFEACCHSLAAWREPSPRSGILAPSIPDCAFMKELKRLRFESDPVFHGGHPPHPDERVEWKDFVDSLHNVGCNEKGFAGLLASHRKSFLMESEKAVPDFIGLAIRTASEVPWVLRFSESTRAPWEPFHPMRVLDWLDSLGLIESLPDGNFRSSPKCFLTQPTLRRTGLGCDVLSDLIAWSLGADGPSAAFLDCHLVDERGDPMGASEILAIKAISAPPEMVLALIQTVPAWNAARRAQFRHLVGARWIRGLEQFGRQTVFGMEVGAGMLHRWEKLGPYLSRIPSLRCRPDRPGAGFDGSTSAPA